MAFRLFSGKPRTESYPKKISTVFTNGGLVYADGSGAIQPADATSGDHIGVIQVTTASTDADYASLTRVQVLVPTDDTVWEADVSTGTFTTAMVGNRYDLTDANGIDVGSTYKKVVTIVGYKSASVALVKINAVIANADVVTS